MVIFMERVINVDGEKCKNCGLCIQDCFVSCLQFSEDKIPEYVPNGNQICLLCQHCMVVCSTGALSLANINPDDLNQTSFVDDEDMLSMIKSRRSVRRYKKKSVPEDKIEKIREMLSYPPTGGNLDNLHFSIVASKEKMDEIRKVTYDSISSLDEDSPLYSMKPMIEASLKAGKDLVYHGAPAMIVCAVNMNNVAQGCETVDPIIALSYFELYAQSLGLGTLWDDFATIVLSQIPEVYSMLEIPDEYTLSFVLVFGIPAIKYPKVPDKNRHSFKIL